jgi:hypothetical protein
MDTTARVRAKRSEQFHDVHHRDFHRDPMGVVRGIYERFDLRLSDEAARGMQAWIDASPTTRHGEHRYRIEDYGITSDQVRARFADYVERHSIH